jgi:hypothetical protein
MAASENALRHYTSLTPMAVPIRREDGLIRLISKLVEVVPAREFGSTAANMPKDFRPSDGSVHRHLVGPDAYNITVGFMELEGFSTETTSELVNNDQGQSRYGEMLRSGDLAEGVQIETIDDKAQHIANALSTISGQRHNRHGDTYNLEKKPQSS